ncbi:hypothetical protein [Motilibacter peucedani]|nr:hypothetical protein [Motilibacter peucedani]
MLESLRRRVPFDAAWLALADPGSSVGYASLASVDLPQGTERYLLGPRMAHDIEQTGTNRARPPLSPSDLPYPAETLPTWAECLHPAGFHEALAVALFDGQRHVGFLALLSEATRPPDAAVRRELQQLTPLLTRGADPMRPLAAAARVVGGAAAGIALCCSGAQLPVPGLPDDALLVDGSPVVTIARS